MKKSPALLAALCAGLLCALYFGWPSTLPRATPDSHSSISSPSLSSPASAHSFSSDSASLSPAAQSLLEGLDRSLARRANRAREAVLTFKDDAAYRRFLARAAAAGLTVVARLDGLRSVRIRYDAFSALRDELARFASDYAAASANALIAVPGLPASTPAKEDRDAVAQVPFGNATLPFLGVPAEHGTWGRGVTIAILDTGVMPDATFGSGRLRTLDIGLGTTAGRGEDDGHGTAVAALAAGASADAAGVAPAASLLSIRVTDASGTSDTFTVAQAIVAATEAGARIINVSLGGYATNAALDAAIAYATERGAVIVAAAGNDQAAQLAWPAADSRVISVGAVDRAGQQVLFSNSGPTLSLTAPGYGVQTAWLDNQRVTVDGTSASAPLVSGALAAVLSQNPALTPQTAAQLLLSTASDAGAPGADADYGHGILNVDWAINRNNPTHYDPAIASHSFDSANNRLLFVVQNRSAAALSGLSLTLTVSGIAGAPVLFTLPPLAAGESHVAAATVDNAALKAAGTLTYTTQLNLPPGLTDAIPGNNRRSSTLTAPK